MESIKEIYKIGYGPSSSHTMGPKIASDRFKAEHPLAASFRITLYGSLAATGKGHLTDIVIAKSFAPLSAEIIWKPAEFLPIHPNAMKLEALDNSGNTLAEQTAYSVGGGKIVYDAEPEAEENVYELNTMDAILNWTKENGTALWEYVEKTEGIEIYDYLAEVWKVMKESIQRGLTNEGTLPGGLHLPRKASSFHIKAASYSGSLKKKTQIFSYALAVCEENASGGRIVTAPTCGSCGIMPAVLARLHDSFDFPDEKILRALATAGIVGNLIKTNASISGADVGCQGEVGAACAMASAASAQLLGGTPYQIEYAAEMGMEHHLGLTCDPIGGLVQIPCIERNAFAAERALNCATFSLLSDGRHIVSFDRIVQTMKRTGHDLPHIYKETSEGGLAVCWE
jgi:L-serine dehydratase